MSLHAWKAINTLCTRLPYFFEDFPLRLSELAENNPEFTDILKEILQSDAFVTALTDILTDQKKLEVGECTPQKFAHVAF